jgi:hypothetical protein
MLHQPYGKVVYFGDSKLLCVLLVFGTSTGGVYLRPTQIRGPPPNGVYA